MTVILSAKASRQLEVLLDYLETKWSSRLRRIFQRRLNLSIQALKVIPQGFPESVRFPGYRKCVVTPQTSLIYRLNGDIIEIVTILYARQE